MKDNWLFIKTPDDYGRPNIVQIDHNNNITYFDLKKGEGISLTKTISKARSEKLTETKHTFINQNRIRLFRKGSICTVLSEEESITTDCIFENDYEKLIATNTELTESEIQNLKFDFDWNGEKMKIRFTEVLDSPMIQELNKTINREETRIVLEKLNKTLFLSLYSDIYLTTQLPIKYVDRQKMILYGFPKEPYEVICPIIK